MISRTFRVLQVLHFSLGYGEVQPCSAKHLYGKDIGRMCECASKQKQRVLERTRDPHR